MRSTIWIFPFLFYLFHLSVSIRKYDRNELDEFVDLLLENSHVHHSKQTSDPNDHIDVQLWNQLNQEDITNMRQIDDYSDEFEAIQWLKWYSRIALRYNQVSSNQNFFR